MTGLRTGLAAVATFAAAVMPVRAEDDAPARGKYLFAVAGCLGCHTDVANKGPALAGGRPLKTPFGTFYTPNITPDRETGIGAWSDRDFVRALRSGLSPDGRHYFPAFPYPSYTRMKETDMRDIKAYIFSLPAVKRVNRDHDVDAPFGWRFLLGVWKWLYFTPGPLRPSGQRDAAWNRGAYIVEALAHCGECHTPRDFMGGPEDDMAYAGTALGPDGDIVPNITPDAETGIGDWSDGEVRTLFEMGMMPDGDFVGGAMGEVIDHTTSQLLPADVHAVITYLRALPPIPNRLGAKPAATGTASD